MAAESNQLDLGIPEQFDTKETNKFSQNGEPKNFSDVKDVSNGTVNHVNNPEQRTEQERPTLNGDHDKTEENLIDLDSPGSDNFNAFLRCRLIERAKNKESCTSSVKDGDCNSITQSMHASHTESGYLTESVTSCSTVGNERTESVSSEGDRTPCIEQIPSESDGMLRNSSCKDCSCVSNNSIPSSANCDKSRPTSSSSAKALELISALDNLDDLKDLDLGSEVKLKTGPRKLIDLDQIFVKCDSNELQARPESLSLPQPLQASERPHSKSDVGWSPSEASCSYKDDKNERKRSKSSGFPIPRVKEGADITGDGLSKSLPHGKIVRKGEMIEYVADDLQEMIRRSSPMSKTGTVSDLINKHCSYKVIRAH